MKEEELEEKKKEIVWGNMVADLKDNILDKDTRSFNVIILLLTVLAVITTLMFVPWVISNAGLTMVELVGMGLMWGFAIGALVFDKPRRVWFLNLMAKSRNYHYVILSLSGKRLVDYVEQVRNEPVKEIQGKSFVIDPNRVYQFRRVPTIICNEKDIMPVSLDANADKNRDPQLVTDYIQARVNKERFKAQHLNKMQQLILYLILGGVMFCLVLGGFNYIKIDDLIKALVGGAKATK